MNIAFIKVSYRLNVHIAQKLLLGWISNYLIQIIHIIFLLIAFNVKYYCDLVRRQYWEYKHYKRIISYCYGKLP